MRTGLIRAARKLERRGDKAAEERVRTVGTGLEFGVILHADIERVIVPLHDLNEPSVRRETGENEPRGGESLAVFVVEFVAVAVTLGDVLRAVAFFPEAIRA